MPSRTTSQPAEVAAFAAALDDFLRASGRAKGRLAADGDLTLSQYHLLEPLLDADGPLGVCALAERRGRGAADGDADARRARARRGSPSAAPARGDRRRVEVTLTAEGAGSCAAKRDAHRRGARGGLPPPRPGERAQAARAPALARRRDRRPASVTPPPTPGSPARTRTARCGILVLGAIAYALAQTMIIPALPAIQHDVGAPRPRPRRGCSPRSCSRRASRRRCSAAWATCTARRSCCSLALGVFGLGSFVSRDRRLDRRAHPRPRDPGRRRRDLPARLRDHPRRVPARAGGHLDRADLGDLRHRRRPRPRARRRDRRPPVRALDLLVLGAGRPRSPRGPPGATCPSRPCASTRRSTGAGAPCSRSRWARSCSASRRATPGAGSSTGVLGLFAAAIVFGAAFVAFERRVPEPMVDMQLMRQRAGVDDEPRRVRDRLRDVRLVRADPAARASCPAVTGYGFAQVHHRGGPVPAAQRAGDARRRSALGLARLRGSARRLPLALGGGVRRAGLLRLALFHERSPRSPSAALLVGIGIGLAFAAMANLVVEAVRHEQTGHRDRRSTRSCARSAARSARRSRRRCRRPPDPGRPLPGRERASPTPSR